MISLSSEFHFFLFPLLFVSDKNCSCFSVHEFFSWLQVQIKC